MAIAGIKPLLCTMQNLENFVSREPSNLCAFGIFSAAIASSLSSGDSRNVYKGSTAVISNIKARPWGPTVNVSLIDSIDVLSSDSESHQTPL